MCPTVTVTVTNSHVVLANHLCVLQSRSRSRIVTSCLPIMRHSVYGHGHGHGHVFLTVHVSSSLTSSLTYGLSWGESKGTGTCFVASVVSSAFRHSTNVGRHVLSPLCSCMCALCIMYMHLEAFHFTYICLSPVCTYLCVYRRHLRTHIHLASLFFCVCV